MAAVSNNHERYQGTGSKASVENITPAVTGRPVLNKVATCKGKAVAQGPGLISVWPNEHSAFAAVFLFDLEALLDHRRREQEVFLDQWQRGPTLG